MIIYNVGFKNSLGEMDETQVEVREANYDEQEIIELVNVILSLKDEMDIQEVQYIDWVNDEEHMDEEDE